MKTLCVHACHFHLFPCKIKVPCKQIDTFRISDKIYFCTNILFIYFHQLKYDLYLYPKYHAKNYENDRLITRVCQYYINNDNKIIYLYQKFVPHFSFPVGLFHGFYLISVIILNYCLFRTIISITQRRQVSLVIHSIWLVIAHYENI